MTRKLVLSSLSLFAALAIFASATHAADSFFAGKTMHIMVAASPGGGFDAYSRMMARHMPRHIPGNPTMIVQNRPGAGGRITANYMYNKAKPDGLTMGMWIGGLILQQYLGDKGVKFDAAKFEWVGAPVRIHNVCMAHKTSGVADLAAWRAAKQPLKFGGQRPGSTMSDIPMILGKHTDLPLKLIEGYGGTAPVRLAAERGEVGGVCASWEGLKNPWAAALKSGDVRVLLQFVDKPHYDLTKVPLGIDQMKTEEGKVVMKTVVHDIGGSLNRPYSLPPGTPKDRVMILRRGVRRRHQGPQAPGRGKGQVRHHARLRRGGGTARGQHRQAAAGADVHHQEDLCCQEVAGATFPPPRGGPRGRTPGRWLAPRDWHTAFTRRA